MWKPLVVLVLLRVFVVLQKNLNLVVHLRTNIIAKAASNDGQHAEAERAQGCCAKTYYIRLLEGFATCCDDLARDPWGFCKGCRAQWQRP